MKVLKKFSLRNVSDKLSDKELKRVLGGYNLDNCDDPAKFYCADCWCGNTYWGKSCGYCPAEVIYSCLINC